MELWPGNGPVWIMGCGNMGGALLSRWLGAGLDPERVTVIDPFAANLAGVRQVKLPPAGSPSLLLLAVKPQMLDETALALAKTVGPETSLVSILAGVDCASLKQRFPQAGAIIRAMPNLPVRIGKGATALYTTDEAAREAASCLFAPTGHVEWLGDESLFDAVTALSGSGPAFLYRFIDAMAKAGATLGLPAEQAMRLAKATVEGSALTAMSAADPPGVLADRVASAGGSTREGLNVLDQGAALDQLLAATLAAAERRNGELAMAARQS